MPNDSLTGTRPFLDKRMIISAQYRRPRSWDAGDQGELEIHAEFELYEGSERSIAAMSLRDFFDRVGITEADCVKAFREGSHQ